MDGMKHSIARDPVDRSSILRKAPNISPPGLRRLRFSFLKPHCQRAEAHQKPETRLRSKKRKEEPHQVSLLGFAFDQELLPPRGVEDTQLWATSVAAAVFRVSTRLFKQQSRFGVNNVSRIFCDNTIFFHCGGITLRADKIISSIGRTRQGCEQLLRSGWRTNFAALRGRFLLFSAAALRRRLELGPVGS